MSPRMNLTRSAKPASYNKSDLIFANPDGTPLKPDSISASTLCKRLKLPMGVKLHTLRHMHGSHLLAAGMEITAVSERLGHSSVRVTADVYLHAIRGRDDEAARKWDEYQRQNCPRKSGRYAANLAGALRVPAVTRKL